MGAKAYPATIHAIETGDFVKFTIGGEEISGFASRVASHGHIYVSGYVLRSVIDDWVNRGIDRVMWHSRNGVAYIPTLPQTSDIVSLLEVGDTIDMETKFGSSYSGKVTKFQSPHVEITVDDPRRIKVLVIHKTNISKVNLLSRNGKAIYTHPWPCKCGNIDGRCRMGCVQEGADMARVQDCYQETDEHRIQRGALRTKLLVAELQVGDQVTFRLRNGSTWTGNLFDSDDGGKLMWGYCRGEMLWPTGRNRYPHSEIEDLIRHTPGIPDEPVRVGSWGYDYRQRMWIRVFSGPGRKWFCPQTKEYRTWVSLHDAEGGERRFISMQRGDDD
jgi:hypothetical protein